MKQATVNIIDRFRGHLYEDVRYLLAIMGWVYLLMVTVALPLYHTGSYARIGSEKQELYIGFLEIYWKILLPLLVLWAVITLWQAIPVWRRAGLSFPLSVTDCFVLVYLAAVLISHFCCAYEENAFLGSPNWSMGTFTQLTFCVEYFIISRCCKAPKWVWVPILGTSAILFVLGYLNRFDIWPIPMEYSTGTGFLSLAGNPNWYCGYLVPTLFAGVFLMWANCSGKNILPGIYLYIGFCALLTNGSTSGLTSLLAVLFLLLLLSLPHREKLSRFLTITAILGLSCATTATVCQIFPDALAYRELAYEPFLHLFFGPTLILFSCLGFSLLRAKLTECCYPTHIMQKISWGLLVLAVFAGFLAVFLLIQNTLSPGSIGPLSDLPVFTFDAQWGSNRGATFQISALAWWEQPFWRKLIGVGADCMGTYLNTDASASLRELLEKCFPDMMLSNAHCEPLTVLVNLGAFGLIAWMGIICSAVYRFLRPCTRAAFSEKNILAGACAVAAFAYFINNLFSFQQILNGPLIFVLLALGAGWYRQADTGEHGC